MANEPINIVIQDQIASSISANLDRIAVSAETAFSTIQRLQQSLSSLDSNVVQGLSRTLDAASTSQDRLTSASARQTNINNAVQGSIEGLSNAYSGFTRAVAENDVTFEAAVRRMENAQVRVVSALGTRVSAETRAINSALNLTTATNNLASSQDRNQQRLENATAKELASFFNRTTASNNLDIARSRAASSLEASAAREIAANQRAEAASLRLTSRELEDLRRVDSFREQSAVRLARYVAETEARVNRVNAVGGARQQFQGPSDLRGAVGQVGAAVGVSIGIKDLAELSDAYQVLQNRLIPVTESQRQINGLTNDLFDIARKTYAPVEEVGRAFSRFDLSLRKVGVSQGETLRLTETVGKALKLSGATATETSSTLLQLSQAFSSQRLAGDELRAISENAPIIAQALFQKFGGTLNSFRKAMNDGKIGILDIMKTIQELGPTIDQQFSRHVITLEDAFTNLKTTAIQTLGELGQKTGIMKAFAEAVGFIEKNLNALVIAGSALLSLGLVSALIAAGQALVFIAALAGPVGLLAAAFAAAAISVFIFRDAVIEVNGKSTTFSTVWSSAIKTIADEFPLLADVAIKTFDFIFNGINNIKNRVKQEINSGLQNRPAETILSAGLGATAGIATGVLTKNPVLAAGAYTIGAGAGSKLGEFVDNLFQGSDFQKKFNSNVFQQETSRRELEREANRGETGKILQETDARRALGEAASKLGTDTKKPNKSLTPGQKQDNIYEQLNLSIQSHVKNLGLDSDAIRINDQVTQAAVRFLQTEKDQTDVKAIARAKDRAESLRPLYEAQQDVLAVERESAKVIDELTGPLKNYRLAVQGVDAALKTQAISEEQANAAKAKLGVTLAKAEDPLFEFNVQMQNQNALLVEQGSAREIASKLLEIQNSYLEKHGNLVGFDTEEVRRNIIANNQLNRASQATSIYYNQTIGAQEKILDQRKALAESAEKYGLSTDYVNVETEKLNSQLEVLKLNLEDTSGWDAIQIGMKQTSQEYKTVNQSLAESSKSFFTGLNKGFADSIAGALVEGKSFSETFSGIFRQLASQVISNLIQIGIQALTTRSLLALSNGGGGSNSGIFGSLLSVAGAFFGAGGATNIVSTGVESGASVAYASSGLTYNLPGRAGGGYTGDGPSDQVGGVFHRKEFVMNANATSRNRAALEAMNAGRDVGRNSGQSDDRPWVIENKTTGRIDKVTTKVDSKERRLILEELADSILDPLSKLSRNYEAAYQGTTRKR